MDAAGGNSDSSSTAGYEGAFWQPSPEQIDQAPVTRFRHFVNARHGLDLQDYWALHAWSTGSPSEINAFWSAVWDFTGILGDKGQGTVFDASRPIHETKDTMNGVRVNWAENMLLAHPFARSSERTAVIACNEPNEHACRANPLSGSFIRKLSFQDLYDEVSMAVATLKALGVGPGDSVGAYTCNNAEAVVFLLATSAVGAVWSSTPPEFGANAVLDRFTQFRPKVLLTVDRYRAAGKIHSVLSKLDTIVPALQPYGLEHVILVGQLEQDRRPASALPKFEGVNSIAYPDSLGSSSEIDFWRGSGNAPLWVLYSSGTTGAPKAIVHNQLGMIFAMKHAGYFHNIFDLSTTSRDVHLQATTTGWMMYNQMVNHLCLGMTIVLYDGSPILRSNKTILFDLVDAHNVTNLSISPRYLQILYQDRLKPKETYSLSHLKSIFSAGSPLTSELYMYIRDNIKQVYIANGTGGTDICGVAIGAIPVLPISAGVLQGAYLGFAIEACDDQGSPIANGQGIGDLVIAKPVPTMPLGFLGDDAAMTRFRATYFNRYSSRTVWYHADCMEIGSDRGVRMHGRTDGVLNPQGVRFGSAELYRILDRLPEIEDCIAVGQKTPDEDEQVILFVKCSAGNGLDAELQEKIRKKITDGLSRRHVPSLMLECPAIPLTVTGKKLEVAVKKLINGADILSINTSGISNPEALAFFARFPSGRTGVKT